MSTETILLVILSMLAGIGIEKILIVSGLIGTIVPPM